MQKTAYETGLGIPAEPLSDLEQESEGILQSPAYHKRKPQRSDEHESEIGRASCRERVEISVVVVKLKKKYIEKSVIRPLRMRAVADMNIKIGLEMCVEGTLIS